VIPIGALATAPAGDNGHSEAAELFLQRSRAIRPGYDPAPADVRAIESICRELSGIPLAIELAAARIRVMAPQALLSRLSQPLRLLAAGPNDAPERHRSMRDAIDWSYQLLDDEQRALLREMGVFAGSVPLDGIESIAAAAGIGARGEVVDLLARLADASMIEPFERETKARFLLSAAVREFLLDELERLGELPAARDRHAAWVEALTETLVRDFAGPREHLAMSRGRAELDNIRSALGWSLEQRNVARAARILGNLSDFWSFGGQSNEGKRWLDRIEPLLDRAGLTPRELHRFWMAAGLIAWAQGDAALAAERHQRSCEMALATGDRAGQAMSLMWQSQAAWYVGDYEAQQRFAAESLALSPERSVSWAGAQTLYGIAEMRLERLDDAERALEIARERHAAIGFTRAAIWTLQLLGDLAMLRGDIAAAARWHRESLRLSLRSSDNWGLFEDLSGLTEMTLKLGWNEDALELLASAELLMTTSSVIPREGSWLSADDRARLKSGLAPDDLQRLAQNAAARSLPQLVARASEIALAIESGKPRVEMQKPPVKRASRGSHPFDLSPREQSVLALLVQGKTDRQISADLEISHGTARSHVAHVLQKLDARNRAAAVRKALELELV
jgi:DNA-binding CsgD family transcriptional regulator